MENNKNIFKSDYKVFNLDDKSKKLKNDEYFKYYLNQEDSIYWFNLYTIDKYFY